MEPVTRVMRFPEEKQYLTRLAAWAEQAMARRAFHPLDPAVPKSRVRPASGARGGAGFSARGGRAGATLEQSESPCPSGGDLRRLREWAVTSPCGEIDWLMPKGDQGRLPQARPTLFQGTVGLGVFFTGVYKATADAGIKSQAEALRRTVLDQLCRYLEPLEKTRIAESGQLDVISGTAGLLQVLCGYIRSCVPIRSRGGL